MLKRMCADVERNGGRTDVLEKSITTAERLILLQDSELQFVMDK